MKWDTCALHNIITCQAYTRTTNCETQRIRIRYKHRVDDQETNASMTKQGVEKIKRLQHVHTAIRGKHVRPILLYRDCLEKQRSKNTRVYITRTTRWNVFFVQRVNLSWHMPAFRTSFPYLVHKFAFTRGSQVLCEWTHYYRKICEIYDVDNTYCDLCKNHSLDSAGCLRSLFPCFVLGYFESHAILYRPFKHSEVLFFLT